jgi:hypothetical protein
MVGGKKYQGGRRLQITLSDEHVAVANDIAFKLGVPIEDVFKYIFSFAVQQYLTSPTMSVIWLKSRLAAEKRKQTKGGK